MRACATLARIRRHYACRLNSSVRPPIEFVRMNQAKLPAYETAMFGYLGLSIVVSLLAFHTDASLIRTFGASSPTAEWLAAHGNNPIAMYFFCMNLALIPISTVLSVVLFRSKLKPLETPSILTIFGLAAMLALLSWFAWFIPADFRAVGTRMRVVQSICANSRLGLGIIYGLIYTSIAVALSAIPRTIRNLCKAEA